MKGKAFIRKRAFDFAVVFPLSDFGHATKIGRFPFSLSPIFPFFLENGTSIRSLQFQNTVSDNRDVHRDSAESIIKN